MSGNEALMVEWVSSEERQILGASVRRLLDAVVATGASRAELSAAATAIDQVTAQLAATVGRLDPVSRPESSHQAQMSLVGGFSHPVAPQLALQVTPDGVAGDVVIGQVFQGGPGLVHGGVIALLIDHAMGYVANHQLEPAMTVRLDLRYRRPTPVGVPLTVAARLDRVDGRKLHLSASITAKDEVTVEADAIFLRLTAGNLDLVFPRVT